jgi:hypothetical protein
MHPVFNMSVLRLDLTSGVYQPPPLPECIEGKFEWQVDDIEKCKGSGKRLQFFVHWLGLSDSNATREKTANLQNCPEKGMEFWDFKGKPYPHSL